MLRPEQKEDAGGAALELYNLDSVNQKIVEHSIHMLLASQVLHESEHDPPAPHDKSA